eukprot:2906786-Lingulodinium_polyedra.AAC.1
MRCCVPGRASASVEAAPLARRQHSSSCLPRPLKTCGVHTEAWKSRLVYPTLAPWSRFRSLARPRRPE